jgi:hypothetical protein
VKYFTKSVSHVAKGEASKQWIYINCKSFKNKPIIDKN